MLCSAGRLCFVFSRWRIVDEESERGKPKLSTLSFEDFLEALVRVATMKALPTYAELALLGARDAGTFLESGYAPRTQLGTLPLSRRASVGGRTRSANRSSAVSSTFSRCCCARSSMGFRAL